MENTANSDELSGNKDTSIDMSSSDSSIDMPTDTEEETCKYCREPATKDNKLIRPCDCSEKVHAKCLEAWKTHRSSRDAKTCEICSAKYLIVQKGIDKRKIALDVTVILAIVWNIINIVGFLGYDHLGEIDEAVHVGVFLGLIVSAIIEALFGTILFVACDEISWRRVFFTLTIEMTLVHFVVAIVTSVIMKTPMFCIFTSAIAFHIVACVNMAFIIFVFIGVCLTEKLCPNGFQERYIQYSYGDHQ